MFSSLFLFYLNREYLKPKIIFSTVTIFIIILVILGSTTRFLSFEIGNDTTRIDALLISLKILKENIVLGLGSKIIQIKDLIVQYSLMMPEIHDKENLGKISTHNFFIYHTLKYGLFSILAILIFLFKYPKRLVNLSILLPFLLSGLFHHGGFLNSSSILIAFFIGYFNIKINQKTVNT